MESYQQRVLFVRRVNFACGTGTALLAERIPLQSKLLVLKDSCTERFIRSIKQKVVDGLKYTVALFICVGEDSTSFLHLFNLII